MFFSGTGTTKKVVTSIGKSISKELKKEYEIIDFTLPHVREDEVHIRKDEILIIGVPVYAGRVPNVLLDYLSKIKGEGALCVPIVLYGNRNFDDALVELSDICTGNGFSVIAAAGFIGEHSFSRILAKGRPDQKDMETVEEFSKDIVSKIKSSSFDMIDQIRGTRPYRKYYRPVNPQGDFVDIRRVKPLTNDKCNDCKICVDLCPMGSINYEDVSKFDSICIKCGACEKGCPEGAKYYSDEDYLRHKIELEIEFQARKEPELFL
jgi:ferredoxin